MAFSDYNIFNMKTKLLLLFTILALTGCTINFERVTRNDWGVVWVIGILFVFFIGSGIKNWAQAKNNYNKNNKDQIS